MGGEISQTFIEVIGYLVILGLAKWMAGPFQRHFMKTAALTRRGRPLEPRREATSRAAPPSGNASEEEKESGESSVLAKAILGVLRYVMVIFGFVSFPLLVLGLTAFLRSGSERWLGESAGNIWHPTHLEAWREFWSVALVAYGVEGTLVGFFGLARRPFPLPDLLRGIVRWAMLAVVALTILRNRLGLDIVPLLASTALAGVVLGVSLRGVLSDLLAGISMQALRTFSVRDWIQAGDIEGEVLETNWRETRIRTWGEEQAIVPNSVLASEKIVNISRPDRRRRLEIRVVTRGDSPPGKVIRVLERTAAGVEGVVGGDGSTSTLAPFAMVEEYLGFAIRYVLFCWIRDFRQTLALKESLARRIWYAFRREGISIAVLPQEEVEEALGWTPVRDASQEEGDDPVRKAEALKSTKFWKEICVDERGEALICQETLLWIAKKMRWEPYTDGEVVVGKGDVGRTCFVLVRGALRLRRGNGAQPEEKEALLEEKHIYGEMSFLCKEQGGRRNATLIACGETSILVMDQETFDELRSCRGVDSALQDLAARRAAANEEYMKALEEAAKKGSKPAKEILRRAKKMLEVLGMGS
jgi:small-conductance mechanosensitive channel/CRP-like cAMP-binding protein